MSMTRRLRVIGLTLGDPYDMWSRSGVNFNVFSRMRTRCDLLNVFDLDLRGLQKIILAATSFSLDRRRWGKKLHQNPQAFRARTATAASLLREVQNRCDIIYQDGAMFMPGWAPPVPFVSYHDSNILLSVGGGPLAHGAHYHGKSLQETIQQERHVYEKAALIFTMSDWLRESLISDFGISEAKVKTVYAGVNLEIQDVPKEYDGRTILFVGQNFERKGGRTLLEAFRLVKREVRHARLVIVGPHLAHQEEGVEVKGFVRDKRLLGSCLREASVFALPSYYEPFGVAFAEAFAHKVPCIGTNICAMPEIIENQKGGFVVSPNDAKTLADRIVTLLKNEQLARCMGNYGFNKVKTTLNWDTVVDKMLAHCTQLGR